MQGYSTNVRETGIYELLPRCVLDEKCRVLLHMRMVRLSFPCLETAILRGVGNISNSTSMCIAVTSFTAMATLKRTFAAASRTVQTPYICASCRSQPIARFARRSASTKTVANSEDAVAADEPATSQLIPTSSPVSSQVRFNDPSEDPNYVPATTWTGLERVGTKAWQRKMRDTGDKFEGYATFTVVWEID